MESLTLKRIFKLCIEEQGVSSSLQFENENDVTTRATDWNRSRFSIFYVFQNTTTLTWVTNTFFLTSQSLIETSVKHTQVMTENSKGMEDVGPSKVSHLSKKTSQWIDIISPDGGPVVNRDLKQEEAVKKTRRPSC